MIASLKHWHVYRPLPSDRPGPPRALVTDGVGYWSRSSAKRAAAESGAEVRGQRPSVRQCTRLDCMMIDPDPERQHLDQLDRHTGDKWQRVQNAGRRSLVRRIA